MKEMKKNRVLALNEEVKNFKIQLGAFSSLENANRIYNQINNQNFNND